MATFDHTTQTGHLAGTPINWAQRMGAQTGQDFVAGTTTAINDRAALLNPGDILQIQNGTYTGDWTFNRDGTASQPIIIKAQNPGTWGARNVIKNTGRITIGGRYTVFGGIRYNWPTGAAANAFLLNDSDIEITDCEIQDIVTTSNSARFMVITASAARTWVHHNRFLNIDNCNALALNVTYPGTIPINCKIEYNTFDDITGSQPAGLWFQLGSLPWVYANNDDLAQTFCVTQYNDIINCNNMETKTTDNTWFRNRFRNGVGSSMAFAVRSGDRQIIKGNHFENYSRGIRMFSKGHSILDNVFLNITGEGAIILPEAALYSQIGTITNAIHERGENILIAGNTIITPTSRGIFLGNAQSGRSGYNYLYSPKNIWIKNNIIRVTTGVGIYLQTPNTAQETGDTSPTTTVDSYHRYVGVQVQNNCIYATGTGVIGDTPADGGTPNDYIAWNDSTQTTGSVVADNIETNPNFSSVHKITGAPCQNAGASFSHNNYTIVGAIDFDGNPRQSGSAVDIGAIEVQVEATSSSSLRFSDTFTDANGTAITAHTPDNDEFAGGWKVSAAGPTIQSNGLAFSAPSQVCYADVGGADQIVSTTFNAGGSDNRVGIRVRNDFASTTFYQLTVRPGANQVVVQKTVAGVLTDLSTVAYTFNLSTTYTIEFSIIRNTLRALIDTAEVASISDDAILTGRQFALVHFQFVNSNARFDALNVSTLNYVNAASVLTQRADVNTKADNYFTAVCAMKQNIQMTGSGTIGARYVDAAAVLNQSVLFPAPGTYQDAVATLTFRADLSPGENTGTVWRKKPAPTTMWRKIT